MLSSSWIYLIHGDVFSYFITGDCGEVLTDGEDDGEDERRDAEVQMHGVLPARRPRHDWLLANGADALLRLPQVYCSQNKLVVKESQERHLDAVACIGEGKELYDLSSWPQIFLSP